ncbi:Leucine-rich repeat neuronal protein 4 [Heterocephalus glaber]|uniref:Leucine-rich repeat neuronal protein 4 n=1 Tax=Heterocephalus glaber TaxID=10181 RepID=G5BY81_HETGA|nr:leucine-rich repeat neuronal protein 4 [Heterocephalus glaber]EHB14242.1 Leucine-rich repeat neuronal protein 4 [Heterocephalus glaber]
MRWTLLLLLLTVQRQSEAGPHQEKASGFGLAPQRSPGSGGSTATTSPCEGLPAAGATAWTLANRNLERLPRCLPRTLQSLDCSHNQLHALSVGELSHLPELQELTLHHNSIATLRWGLRAPPGLRVLDLSYNRLNKLPQCLIPPRHTPSVLELAGNPLRELPARAFVCFPALQQLNLSSTELGGGAQGGIARAAFAGAAGEPLATLKVLDLSGTHLQQIESGWIRNLPNLTHLYLRKMPRLRTLEGDIFKMTPNLQQLDCHDSPDLTSVHTHIFRDTPSLQTLLFHNCNLSSFPPWTMNSSQVPSVTLFGNPLTCSCELSWLFMDAERTVLSRAADTMCSPAAGSRGPFSAPLPLSQLPGVCRSDLLASNQPVGGQPSVTKGSSHLTPSDNGIPVILLDDDSQEERDREEVDVPTQPGRCDYNLCRHLQTPCLELQKHSHCTCPGLSREDTVPDPPQLQRVSELTDTSVLIRWCAPYSVVRTYQIHYFTEGDARNQSVGDIYATARQHPLYGLSPSTTYQVCVVAANAAGLSQLEPMGWRRPCTTVTTKPSSVVILMALGTACSLLLLSTLVLSVCLFRQGQKLCRHNHNTYLVSFKNPYLMPLENPGQDCRQSAVMGVLPGVCEAPGSIPSTTQRGEEPAFDPVKLQTFY